jgi:hypothetical protein
MKNKNKVFILYIENNLWFFSQHDAAKSITEKLNNKLLDKFKNINNKLLDKFRNINILNKL